MADIHLCLSLVQVAAKHSDNEGAAHWWVERKKKNFIQEKESKLKLRRVSFPRELTLTLTLNYLRLSQEDLVAQDNKWITTEGVKTQAAILKIDLTKYSSHRRRIMYDEALQRKEIKACCVTF